jgi:DNA-binding response OmpR family regulator
MEELIVRIKARLADPGEALKSDSDTTVYQVGTYKFDHMKQTLEFRNQITKLTHREAEILRLLCLNRSQVVERSFVLKKVWGDDNFFNARSMDVFITKLRKHLQYDSNVEILNVRGIGYKMIF